MIIIQAKFVLVLMKFFKIIRLAIADNAGFTLTFWLAVSSQQAKMCPECLPEPANAGPRAGGRRASLARSGRAREPTKCSRAQQVKLVV
jgi:hypothetical protein